MKQAEKKRITVSAVVGSPVDRVWKLWNEPEHITCWNFASDDWHCPRVENDLRVGGKLLSRMEAKDGSFGFDFEAVYDEVDPHKRISYTMTDGRRATTDFEDLDDRSKITTIFDADTAHPVDMQREGWQAIMNNFRKYAESKSE